MNAMIYILFASIFLTDYFVSHGLFHHALTYLPEVLSLTVMLVVILFSAKKKSIRLPPAYMAIIMLIVLSVVSGIVLNSVAASTVFAGIRTYFKYVPLFFLPLFYEFSDQQIRRQMLLLFCLTAVQLPVSLYQRLIESEGVLSGDYVSGTFGSSGKLTVYLVCASAVFTAFYLRKYLKLYQLLIALTVFLIPTMINETKVTILLLPLAILIPIIVSLRSKNGMKQVVSVVFVAITFISAFIPVYDHYMVPRWGYGIVDFFTMEGRVDEYLSKGSEKIERGRYGRLDAIKLPLQELSSDSSRLVFGVGIGNVSESFLGDRFSGEYAEKYGAALRGSASVLLWEVGLLGTALMFLFFGLVFTDSFRQNKRDDISGALSLGWTSVTFVAMISMFYTDLINFNAFSYILWFYSGYIVATASKREKVLGDGSEMVMDRACNKITTYVNASTR